MLARLGFGCGAGRAWADEMPLRLSISEEVLKGVNRNDAAAAIGVWADEMARAVSVKVAPGQEWLRPTNDLVAAVRGGEVDAVCVTMAEYRKVAPFLDVTQVLTDTGSEMLLLVKEGSGIRSLSSLAGKHLILLDGPHTLLAEAWLAVSLAKEGLGTPASLLGRFSRTTKPTQAVLPVFFGQADACIASRKTVQTMAELNPQLSKKLTVLLQAPKMINVFLGCRKTYSARARSILFEKVLRSRESVAGKQVVTLFHALDFVLVDGEALKPSLVLLDAAERLP